MRSRLLLPFAFFAALARPALSLSCAYLDAAAMFQQAAESSERYVIVRGAFLRNGPDMPLPPDTDDPVTPL